ncbi:MAG: hypothetical protein COW48_09500 [Hydrogenophilales bacterium CG17_big_fil_post_rev_8_21_14_2_50_63_12]|nr:MAG: hypothetical protein COW48_09500 [Hydrogenophilales bacterium CG17_big_fil_post_rev_8_21_14_2_50_63_12]PIX96333.1 MAG: hypothetical protein COZ24_11075 [Hydrogenophilales bacterium CG_4_10_14_3_um_filter_63_21]
MADFMSVLAASQKQGPSGTHGKALPALLPGDLFERVLSAQIETTTEGEARLLPLPLPLALSDEFTVPAKPVVKKPLLAAAVDADQPVEFAVVPFAVANGMEAEKSTPDIAPDARPTLSPTRPEKAASPAVFSAGQGQNLPLDDPLAGRGQTDPLIEIEMAETLPPRGVASTPEEAAKSLDLLTVAASRQLGQFEQLARMPETRVQAAIDAPVRGQAFVAEFSEKIVWLAGRQSQVADLSLNPPHLGTLEVRLSLSGSDAGAQFYSPNPVVREAIEAALPRLRELMAQAGIVLGDAQVRDESFARHEAGGSARAGGEPSSDEAIASLAPAGAMAIRAGLGLVDLYA